MIYIDVSAAVHSRAGLGRYSERLASEMAKTIPGRVALFHNLAHDGQLPPSLTHLPRQHIPYGYKPWRMAVLLAQTGRVNFNRLIPNAQLFHSTEHLLMPLRHIPTILTVHDLIFKRFPAYHKRLNYWYLNLAMPLYCRRATAIIAVSEATKRDVVKEYGINPAKIHVIYEASAEHFQPPTPEQIAHVRQKYHLPDPFLLHIGTIEPRKNLSRLLDALQHLRHNHPHLKLILVGAKGWLYDDFFAKISADGLTDIVRSLGWVPDEDLPAVIASATLAVQPSLYEGFGLPILEHMACGQVVAASNTGSHPEVGGTAAAYFDPTNTAEMATVIGRLLSGRDEYQHRQQLSLAQASHFSWQKTAHQTKQLYDQILISH